jgi:Xaa-Pro aminopeptidase
MQTVHPVVVFGSYQLDEERLPPDEFQIRLGAVQAAIKAKGWAGLIAFGNAETCSLVTYVSNYSPRVRQALLLVPPSGPPRLLIWTSPRDHKREAAMTWIEDARMSGKVDQTVGEWLTDAKIDGGTIGLFGAGNARPPVYEAVSEALAGKNLVADGADAEMAALMLPKRPREMVMMRQASAILADAVDALTTAWADGVDAADAVLAAERTAYARTAQDVRTLVSLDGGRTLRPLYRAVSRPDRLIAYIALRYQAYWVEAFVTLGGRSAIDAAATDALAALVDAARPGMTGRGLTAALPEAARQFSPHPILAGSLGHAIGLALDEAPVLTGDSDVPMRPRGTYSLTVGLTDDAGTNAFASAVVAVSDDGCDVLWKA